MDCGSIELMRVEPPSAAKAKGKRHAAPATKPYPGWGTINRRILDFFLERRGIVIECSLQDIATQCGLTLKSGRVSRHISDLTDFWGMDIRKLGNRRWVLAGEWRGSSYTDFISARIDDAEHKP